MEPYLLYRQNIRRRHVRVKNKTDKFAGGREATSLLNTDI